jgi:hypothetical protein
VHAKCAVQWFKHNPSKGVACQVCLTELATRYSHRVEKHPFVGTLYWRCIERPAMFINLFHWMFYCVSVFLDLQSKRALPFSAPAYCILQGVYHFYMGYMFYLCIGAVHNRRHYWAYWYRTHRICIPLAHCFFLAAIPYQKMLAGLSADICLMYYSMEHVEILDAMNRSVKIEFVSATEEQEQEQQEQPSSE